MDGTFSVPPHPFKQLYTIRVPFKDVTGTAVDAFLPSKWVSNCAFGVFFTGQQGLDIVVTLGKDLAGFVSSVVLTGNSSSLLFQLPCQQPTFQCPDFEDAVLRAVTAVFGRHINHC
jgi:hypothetical protein